MKSFFGRIFALSLCISLVCCQPSNIIPERDMVKILVKIYLTDGTLSQLERSQFMYKDTIDYYGPILEQFGYTSSQFDSSINYYAHHLQTFDEIHDRVIFELGQIENQYTQKSAVDEVTGSRKDHDPGLWPLKSFWNMANAPDYNPHVGFNVNIIGVGRYVISFDAQIFEDDSVPDPHFRAYLHHGTADTIIGELFNDQSFYYKKVSENKTFTFNFDVNDPMMTILGGYLYLYNSDKISPNCKKHSIFSNIQVKFIPKSQLKEEPDSNGVKMSDTASTQVDTKPKKYEGEAKKVRLLKAQKLELKKFE